MTVINASFNTPTLKSKGARSLQNRKPNTQLHGMPHASKISACCTRVWWGDEIMLHIDFVNLSA